MPAIASWSISISITYSPATNQPVHLHTLYEQVKEASLHRMFYGHGRIIDSDDILAIKTKDYIYPADKEKRFSEAIKTGKSGALEFRSGLAWTFICPPWTRSKR